jgi:hypothetical protein
VFWNRPVDDASDSMFVELALSRKNVVFPVGVETMLKLTTEG